LIPATGDYCARGDITADALHGVGNALIVIGRLVFLGATRSGAEKQSDHEDNQSLAQQHYLILKRTGKGLATVRTSNA
jgi:hypothetical protein